MRTTDLPPLAETLDRTLDEVRAGAVAPVLQSLVATLARLRRVSSPEDWSQAIELARAHELCRWIHSDPFALRCFAKPRGYAPDGTAIDYVLAQGDDAPATNPLQGFMLQTRTARALRFRRDHLAREIDEAAGRWSVPIHAFAASRGHFRECEGMKHLSSGRVAQLVAFDVDKENLGRVRHDYPGLRIATHPGSIRQLLAGKHLFGDMHVVYTAGMLETMPQSSAAGLVRALFAMLSPGGTLILTHFLANLEEAAFLEMFLDWRMVYRTESDIYELVHALPRDAVRKWAYSENADATLGVMSVQRA